MVLVIQMQGATINTGNTANFGNINNINCAGCLEYNRVQSISANVITLENAPTNSYNTTNGAVQLITVPVYQAPVITSTLTCTPWNGTTGGVIVFNACDSVTLNADISVSGDGFRGGNFCTSFFNCATSTYGLNFAASTNCAAGEKGEGITTTTTALSGGRGKRANGGGGSMPGNSGGGGGGNFGAGGIGGNVYSGCTPGNQGVGGIALTYPSTKAFMGGGGGGGYRDNGQTVTNGGNGGGIVIISAPSIVGNSNSILANGNDVTTNTNDEGAGAGGAGGTVLLNTDLISGTLNVQVNGGDGGTTLNSIFTNQCHGPGGGGGGGMVWYKGASIPTNLSIATAGGASGIVANPLSSCFNTTFGGADGSGGGSQLNLSLNTIGSSGINLAVTPASLTICLGQSDTLVASGAFSYTWTPSIGLDTNMGSTVIASPTATTTYTVTAISCDDTATLDVVVTVLPAPAVQLVGLSNPYCINDPSSPLTATPAGGNLTGNGISGFTYYPDSAGVGNDTVTYAYTATNGCIITVVENITVYGLPSVSIQNLAAAYCVNDNLVPVTGTSANGSFSGPGINGSAFFPASAAVGTHSIYYAFNDSNGCSNTDTQQVVVHALPTVTFTGLPNNMCLDDSAAALVGTPTPGVFSGFGIGLMTFNPGTAGAGFHQVSYTHTDANGCANNDTQIVEVKPLPVVDFSGLNPSYCVNNLANEIFPSPTGGVFSGPGLSGNYFDPKEAGLGTHSILYTYQDEFGCVGTRAHLTTVTPKPSVAFAGIKPTYCQDEAPSDLLGIPAGGIFTGSGIDDESFDPAIAGSGDHTITYTFEDQNGCESSMTRHTSVFPRVEILFNENENSYCLDADPIRFSVSPQGGLWLSDGFINNRLHPDRLGTGKHVVRYIVSDENGCGSESEKEFWIRPLPEIDIISLPDVFCNPDPVPLAASPTGGLFSGIGVNGDLFYPNEAGAGKHVITYRYTDEYGCSNVDNTTVPGACHSIYIPNAFSPNGDNYNDYFLPTGENITHFKLTIFDRWGKSIFHSDDATIGWSGQFDGKLSPGGVYVWKLEYRLGSEPTQTLVGHVTLISEAKRL